MRTRIASGFLTAAALAAIVAGPAHAQKTSAQGAAQIFVTEANWPDAYTAVGALNVAVHPKSVNPKTPTRDLLDAELRKQAAKMGAEAVIQVRYTLRNPMLSDKGREAMGVAVRFTSVAVAPPAPQPQPQIQAQASVASATTALAPRTAAVIEPRIAPQPAPTAPMPVAPAQVAAGRAGMQRPSI